jgi:hypothetical protein
MVDGLWPMASLKHLKYFNFTRQRKQSIFLKIYKVEQINLLNLFLLNLKSIGVSLRAGLSITSPAAHQAITLRAFHYYPSRKFYFT